MASKYYEFDRAYDETVAGRYLNTVDIYPIPNYWRGNPLSDKNYIRSNVAGYYPYPRQNVLTVDRSNNDDWKYIWQHVCTTITPNNPQYEKKKEPILYR